MSRVCPVTGKKPISGNKRSHSLRATRRRWDINLQTYKIEIDDNAETLTLTDGDGSVVMTKVSG